METSFWVHAIPQYFPPKKLIPKTHGNDLSCQSIGTPKNNLQKTNSKIHGNDISSQSRKSPKINLQITKSSPKQAKRRLPPIYTKTNPYDVNIDELRALLTATQQNCDQFPEILDDGSVKPVDPKKLRVALLNSSVVVSVYTGVNPYKWLENLFYGRTPEEFLVGFGRATSDSSLTASIHDLAVAPSLQGLGIGRKVLERIIRILTGRGINDIAAVCSEKQRPFFEACGFADDVLNSTTMFYSRSATNCKEDECIKYFGRKP
ncbi:hypothetical protein KI387_025468, partial [Taxus chinensis]